MRVRKSTNSEYMDKTYQALEQLADRVLAQPTPRDRFVMAKRALYAIQEENKPNDHSHSKPR